MICNLMDLTKLFSKPKDADISRHVTFRASLPKTFHVEPIMSLCAKFHIFATICAIHIFFRPNSPVVNKSLSLVRREGASNETTDNMANET